MKFVIGLDMGTTACEATALDHREQVVASIRSIMPVCKSSTKQSEQCIDYRNVGNPSSVGVLFTTIDTSQFTLHRVCHKEREALWRGP